MKICFYAAVDDPALFDLVEFYRQDVRALRELGHEVRLVNRPSDLRGDDDLYWVWWLTSGAPAVVWAWIRRRPALLLTASSTRDPVVGLPLKPVWARAAARISVALAEVTVPTSQQTARELTGYRPRAVKTIPLAVDTEFYTPSHGAALAEPPYVLTVSHLTRDNIERKRLLDVVRVAAELRALGSPLRVVICGGGDGAAVLRAEVARLALDDRVMLPGRVDREEKRRLLRGATVYLQPTRYEAFGLAIVEAMSCGLPVVTSAVGAVPEVVGNAATLLAPDAAAPEMASAVVTVAGSGDGGAAARRRVVEHFSYTVRRRRLADLIRAVA